MKINEKNAYTIDISEIGLQNEISLTVQAKSLDDAEFERLK